jgi:hypothetical protein
MRAVPTKSYVDGHDIPAGQLVQFVERANEYVPIGQGMGEASVVGQRKPAGH